LIQCRAHPLGAPAAGVVEILEQRRLRWINGEKWRTSNAIPLAYDLLGRAGSQLEAHSAISQESQGLLTARRGPDWIFDICDHPPSVR